MINKLDFETGEGAQIHKTGLNEDLKLLAETINQLIDEVNRLGKLTEHLFEQDNRQIKLWEGLRDILMNVQEKNKPD
jgi:hypothetical protein